jgi:cysteinyl-tRNA synthetase
MSITLYNTLTRKKEPFTPIDPANVRMYVCGPTVYDFAHIGNARPVIVFDVLFRLLRHEFGADHVTYVRNITDVDDKINDRAARDYPDLPLNEAIRKVTESTAQQYHADVAALGCLEPTVEPRATDNIKEMVEIIQRLLNTDHAYIAAGAQGREVLFAVGSMPAYGALSNRKLDEQIEGARVAVEAHKRNPADFVLWKESAATEPGWSAAFSEAGQQVSIYGRPGWHIECSAMSHRYLGETFDIHGGGIDLVFPHHENEIAQSCCAFDTPRMANVWMHNGFLQVEGQKMSKSLGNFVTIHELLATDTFGGRAWSGEVLRLAMLKTHYRQPIDFTVARLLEAEKLLKRYYMAYEAYSHVQPGGDVSRLIAALENDLDTHSACQEFDRYGNNAFAGVIGIQDEIAGEPKPPTGADAVARMLKAGKILGLLQMSLEQWRSVHSEKIDDLVVDRAINERIKARIEARKAKNFAESDRIRDELVAMGVQLKDGKDADGNLTTEWEVKR